MANSKTEKKTAAKASSKTTATKASSKTTTTKAAPTKKTTKEAQPEPVVEQIVAAPAKPTATKNTRAAKKTATTVRAPKNLKVTKRGAGQKGGNAEQEDEPGKRYFKCIMINSNDEVLATGRYSGKKPKQAASKAFTKLYEDLVEEGRELPESIIFGMHECTRLSKRKKKYFYIGKRVELEQPEEVAIHMRDPVTKKVLLDKKGQKIPKLDKDGNPVVIKYNHNNDVRKLTDVENHPEYVRLFNYDQKEDAAQVGGKVKVVKKGKKTATRKTTTKGASKAAGKKTGTKTATKGKKTVVKKDANIKVKRATKQASKAPAKGASKTKNAKN